MKSFLEKLGTAMVSGNLGTGKSVLMNDFLAKGHLRTVAACCKMLKMLQTLAYVEVLGPWL